jgi:hypothetical protein
MPKERVTCPKSLRKGVAGGGVADCVADKQPLDHVSGKIYCQGSK